MYWGRRTKRAIVRLRATYPPAVKFIIFLAGRFMTEPIPRFVLIPQPKQKRQGLGSLKDDPPPRGKPRGIGAGSQRFVAAPPLFSSALIPMPRTQGIRAGRCR